MWACVRACGVSLASGGAALALAELFPTGARGLALGVAAALDTLAALAQPLLEATVPPSFSTHSPPRPDRLVMTD